MIDFPFKQGYLQHSYVWHTGSWLVNVSERTYCTHIQIYIYVSINIDMYINIYLCVCAYICACYCLYVWDNVQCALLRKCISHPEGVYLAINQIAVRYPVFTQLRTKVIIFSQYMYIYQRIILLIKKINVCFFKKIVR